MSWQCFQLRWRWEVRCLFGGIGDMSSCFTSFVASLLRALALLTLMLTSSASRTAALINQRTVQLQASLAMGHFVHGLTGRLE